MRPKPFALLFLLVFVTPLSAKNDQQNLQYQQGLGAAQNGDFADAYCVWKPLAFSGHKDAQYSIGWLYANGDGLQVNIDSAIIWWKRAAAQKHVEANFSLGQTYLTGEGVKRDRLEAVRWFVEAAALGHGEARQVLMTLAQDPNRRVRELVAEVASPDWGIGIRRQVRVKVSSANIRQTPSTAARVIGTLRKGQLVLELNRAKEWVQVSMPPTGQSGWVHSSLMETP